MTDKCCDNCKHKDVFGLVAFCSDCIYKGVDKWAEKEESPVKILTEIKIKGTDGEEVFVPLKDIKQRIQESLEKAESECQYDSEMLHSGNKRIYRDAFDWALKE